MPNSVSRRFVLGLAFASAFLMPGAALAAENGITDYTPETLAAAQASGEPYLLDFFAPWCSTCRAQERVIQGLLESNPAFQDIEIIRVDWDTNRSGPLATSLAIPRRSTLVMMQGESELGRLVADTREDSIAGLLGLGV